MTDREHFIATLQACYWGDKGAYNHVVKIYDNLQEQNQKLKELCDKYEEEHNSAFKLWTTQMEEMPDYEERMKLKQENQKLKETIKEAKEKTIKLQEKYNYILDDLTFILARGIDYE